MESREQVKDADLVLSNSQIKDIDENRLKNVSQFYLTLQQFKEKEESKISKMVLLKEILNKVLFESEVYIRTIMIFVNSDDVVEKVKDIFESNENFQKFRKLTCYSMARDESNKRKQVLLSFENKNYFVMVTTKHLSRGIDFD